MDEDGFTLPELLAVLLVMGILIAIAVGSFAGARTRATDATAKSNIVVAVPAFQAYYLDNGTYVGMTLARLRTRYSRAIPNLTVVSVNATSYCIRSTVGTRHWYKAGPTAQVTTTRCR